MILTESITINPEESLVFAYSAFGVVAVRNLAI
jgi:hypothetical protein